LVCSPEFPSKPFTRVSRKGEMGFTFSNELFGTDGPVALRWGTFFVLMKMEGIDSSAVYAKWHLRLGRSIHPISIPWKYTNAELIEMLGRIVKRLRPKEFPEPPRAGRKGRGKSLGGLERLQQLAAYRLSKRGISFDDPKWKNYHVYQSKPGYENAARSAAVRINTITEIPFFDRKPSVV
jgi:hypothetical protein